MDTIYGHFDDLQIEEYKEKLHKEMFWLLLYKCKLRSNGMPVPLLRNGYSIFNGTKYR